MLPPLVAERRPRRMYADFDDSHHEKIKLSPILIPSVHQAFQLRHISLKEGAQHIVHDLGRNDREAASGGRGRPRILPIAGNGW